jgi:anti-anti-sigma factor
MAFDVQVLTKGEGSYVVIPNGSLDDRTCELCQHKLEPLIDPRTKVLHFDMYMLYYMNSTGLRLLLNVKKAIEDEGGKFQMLNMQPQIVKLMDIAAGPVMSNSEIANCRGLDRVRMLTYSRMEQKKPA